jgi:hypothetical protein
MAKPSDPEPNPQEAQRDGQSAISQQDPLRELQQNGSADSNQAIGPRSTTPELTDEEVSVLCDIERGGSNISKKQRVLQRLVEGGFVMLSDNSPVLAKLTPRAQQLLGMRGVGLNES